MLCCSQFLFFCCFSKLSTLVLLKVLASCLLHCQMVSVIPIDHARLNGSDQVGLQQWHWLAFLQSSSPCIW